MTEQEDSEFTHPHTHTPTHIKTAAIYRATLSEKNLKTSKIAFLQQGYKERSGLPWWFSGKESA